MREEAPLCIRSGRAGHLDVSLRCQIEATELPGVALWGPPEHRMLKRPAISDLVIYGTAKSQGTGPFHRTTYIHIYTPMATTKLARACDHPLRQANAGTNNHYSNSAVAPSTS